MVRCASCLPFNCAQVLTSELFGLSHFASNHSVMHLAPTLGGLLMSATLAGNLYERAGGEARRPARRLLRPGLLPVRLFHPHAAVRSTP